MTIKMYVWTVKTSTTTSCDTHIADSYTVVAATTESAMNKAAQCNRFGANEVFVSVTRGAEIDNV